MQNLLFYSNIKLIILYKQFYIIFMVTVDYIYTYDKIIPNLLNNIRYMFAKSWCD